MSRFGFVADDKRLLIPDALSSEYLVAVTLFPLPGGPRRLRGLVHFRGHAVAVMDVSEQPLPGRVIHQADVLVLQCDREPANASVSDSWLGIICQSKPEPVLLITDGSGNPLPSDGEVNDKVQATEYADSAERAAGTNCAQSRERWFDAALSPAQRATDGGLWYEPDLKRLADLGFEPAGWDESAADTASIEKPAS